MSEIQRYHFFGNTRYREPGSASTDDCVFTVSPPFVLSNPANYFVALIGSAEIPATFNSINSTNNRLRYALQIGSNPVTYQYAVIPSGNYTAYTLIAAYKAAMLAVVPGGPYTFRFGLTYDIDTRKYTFGVTNAGSPGETLILVGIYFTENEFLAKVFGCIDVTNALFGYQSSTYANFTGITNINTNPISSVYIRSTNLKQRLNQESMVAGAKNDLSDILCKIQCMTPPGTYIFYNGELGLSARITNQVIDRLELYLSDNSSFALNLHKNDWTFRLTFIEMAPASDGNGHTKALNGQMHGPGLTPAITDPSAQTTQAATEAGPEAEDEPVAAPTRGKRFQKDL